MTKNTPREEMLDVISELQKLCLKNGCPACGGIEYHTVPNIDNNEIYVWCDNCDMSMVIAI